MADNGDKQFIICILAMNFNAISCYVINCVFMSACVLLLLPLKKRREKKCFPQERVFGLGPYADVLSERIM